MNSHITTFLSYALRSQALCEFSSLWSFVVLVGWRIVLAPSIPVLCTVLCCHSWGTGAFPAQWGFLIPFNQHCLKVLPTKAKLWFISRLCASRLYFYACMKNGVTTESLHALLFQLQAMEMPHHHAYPVNKTASISLHQANQLYIYNGEPTVVSAKKKVLKKDKKKLRVWITWNINQVFQSGHEGVKQAGFLLQFLLFRKLRNNFSKLKEKRGKWVRVISWLVSAMDLCECWEATHLLCLT